MNDKIEIDITQNKLNVETNEKINVVVHKTDLTNYYTIPETDLKFLSKEQAQNTYATISSVDELSNIINSNRGIIDSIQSEINVMKESLVNVKSSADEAKNKAQEAYNLALEIDGSPRGVYANLSALQTAYPNGASGVYLTSDNGHWHYWNGTEWKDGGVYRTDLSYEEVKGTLENLVVYLDLHKKFGSKNNYGLYTDTGTEVNNANFWITNYIELSKKYIVSNKNIYKVCYYDEGKNYLNAVARNTSFLIPSNAKYCRLQLIKADIPYGDSTLIVRNIDEPSLGSDLKYLELNKDKTILNIEENDLSKDLKTSINNLNNIINVEYEMGSIDGGLGTNLELSTRVRTKNYINIDDYYCIIDSDNNQLYVFCYDEKYNFIGRYYGNSWLDTPPTKNEILEIYPTTMYIRLAFPVTTIDAVSNVLICGSENYYKTLVAYEKTKHIDTEDITSGFLYYGEKIVLDNYCKFKSLNYSAIGQDACQYLNMLFSFNSQGTCKVVNTTSGETVSTFTIDMYDTIKPHCNSAVFSNIKYDVNDKYPLIYINTYNTSDLPLGTCYVHRIIETDGVPSGTALVQTITIGFTNNELWTTGNDIRPYGNFIIDTDNNYLWVYTLRDNDKKTRFFKFALPNLDNSSVLLNISDILEQFDTDYMSYIQGNTYHNGKLYICSGAGTSEYHGYLNVVDLVKKCIVTKIDIYAQLKLAWEPEFINIVDGKIIMGETTAYEFTF